MTGLSLTEHGAMVVANIRSMTDPGIVRHVRAMLQGRSGGTPTVVTTSLAVGVSLSQLGDGRPVVPPVFAGPRLSTTDRRVRRAIGKAPGAVTGKGVHQREPFSPRVAGARRMVGLSLFGHVKAPILVGGDETTRDVPVCLSFRLRLACLDRPLRHTSLSPKTLFGSDPG
jgi:hypothetical protein